MLKTEYAKEITLGEYLFLYEKYGLTLEINDGEVATAHFEEV